LSISFPHRAAFHECPVVRGPHFSLQTFGFEKDLAAAMRKALRKAIHASKILPGEVKAPVIMPYPVASPRNRKPTWKGDRQVLDKPAHSRHPPPR
jgi:hypothetical protein